LTKTIDHLTREPALLDPVRPGELEAAHSAPMRSASAPRHATSWRRSDSKFLVYGIQHPNPVTPVSDLGEAR
jgi:hypothetical protein